MYAKTLMGKNFRIEAAEGEPGKYCLSWGEEKMKWEPKPFYPEELKQKGPLFYVEYADLKVFPYNHRSKNEKNLPLSTCKTVRPFLVLS